MADRMFTRELLGKDVETVTGRRVGVLEDLVIDCNSGSLKYLIVSTDNTIISMTQKVDEFGRLVVATDCIRVDGDRIVIN